MTRYLCAAAYLEREYGRSLVKGVAAEPHLGVAAAPACDVPVVLRHAYRANARRHGRDILLAFLLLFLLVFQLWVGMPWIALLMLFLAWVTVFSFELSTKYGRSMQSLRPDGFDPAAAPEPISLSVAVRLREIGEYAEGNVTTYSGYSPFAGYGSDRDSWSLAFDVTSPSRPGVEPQDFDVVDLYAHVAGRLATLGLPCLEIEERLFVDGSAVREDRRFLPDPLGRPVPAITSGAMDALKRSPEEKARPYLGVHSTGWGGELVTSLFIRFVRSESSLVVEASPTVLFPLRDGYRVVDTLMPGPTLFEVLGLAAGTLVPTVFELLASPWRAIAGFAPDFWMYFRVRGQDRLITQLRRFDYGAREAVRRNVADQSHQRYFQEADSGMVLKAIEKRVLNAIVEFAEAHGIHTDELVQRQELIINHGIIASHGASVHASSVASGENSSISSKILSKLPRVKMD
ncbi:zinc ribbon domain-containing protein [Streptomyces sp. NBC_01343]|uniref:zinc ribbon domain-containing protein n=1 Tax=Streptomyces sp. NBC_01343 TaxID=2903832 RepID=UPI002E12E9B2|nr:zinc ribbon domain-containing protein [Streptomyces sp. NBC_01343]